MSQHVTLNPDQAYEESIDGDLEPMNLVRAPLFENLTSNDFSISNK
jgi:hypothetical protein